MKKKAVNKATQLTIYKSIVRGGYNRLINNYLAKVHDEQAVVDGSWAEAQRRIRLLLAGKERKLYFVLKDSGDVDVVSDDGHESEENEGDADEVKSSCPREREEVVANDQSS